MGWLFSRNKNIRSTHEAETLRNVFRDNCEIFAKVGKSEDLKRFRELEEYVTSSVFRSRRKEIEQLSYKNSEYYTAEKNYKALLKSDKLRAFYLIRGSQELGGYMKVRESELYREYIKYRVIVKSQEFDKKIHAAEYAAYKKLLTDLKLRAALKLEKNRKFRYYSEIKDTKLPEEFERLAAFIKTDEFKQNRTYLLNKKRYLTTDDYKLLCEYETLKKRPDLVKYFALKEDPFFNNMMKWEPVFEDNFNNGRLDNGRWITRYYAGERFLNDTYGVGNDVQLFTADNVSFNENAVCLNFRKESIIGKYWDQNLGIKERKYDYTSAILSTATSFRQAYGKFEAKIKLNRSAVNQCFWMKGDTELPHINILKSGLDGVCMGNCFSRHTKPGHSLQNICDLKLASDYYIFTLEWTKEKMVWRINDYVVKEVHENIPDIPMYILFSLGSTENPSDKYVPSKMDIDWIRVYKVKDMG